MFARGQNLRGSWDTSERWIFLALVDADISVSAAAVSAGWLLCISEASAGFWFCTAEESAGFSFCTAEESTGFLFCTAEESTGFSFCIVEMVFNLRISASKKRSDAIQNREGAFPGSLMRKPSICASGRPSGNRDSETDRRVEILCPKQFNTAICSDSRTSSSPRKKALSSIEAPFPTGMPRAWI